MLYEEKDYLMREIKRIAYYIAKHILKKNTVEYDFQSVTQDSDTDLLYKMLMALLAEKRSIKQKILYLKRWKRTNKCL